MTTEIELKLSLTPETARRLARLPLLRSRAAGRPHRAQLETVYFDTPDLALKSRGVALRIRRSNRQWVQTVKGGGSAHGGLHTRHEWETRVAHGLPELQLLPPPAQDLLAHIEDVGNRLRPVFTTRFQRTTWNLRAPTADIELALDVGEIRAGRRRLPLTEVEFELKAGDPQALFDLALELLDVLPMLPEPRSKAERGYALYTHTATAPVRAAAVTLEVGGTTGLAFQRIVNACLLHMSVNHFGTLHSRDPEFLHQFRVALRRLRAAFSLFSPLIASPAAEALKNDLRDLARALNAARDWDVWLADTLPRLAQTKSRAAASTLARRSRPRQARHRHDVHAALADPAYARLMLRLERWLGTLPQTGLKPSQRRLWRTPVHVFAATSLAQLDEAVRIRGRRLNRLTVPQRHKLRIAVKKLRYGLEFFAAVFPPETTDAYIEQLARLQDELGLFNDLAVADSLLAELRGARPSRAFEIAHAWLRAQDAAHRQRLKKRWKRFARSVPFWQA